MTEIKLNFESDHSELIETLNEFVLKSKILLYYDKELTVTIEQCLLYVLEQLVTKYVFIPSTYLLWICNKRDCSDINAYINVLNWVHVSRRFYYEFEKIDELFPRIFTYINKVLLQAYKSGIITVDTLIKNL